ncbi:hypothetical protein [Butyrivibrio sp. AE3006]|uniref:hypothetical protein n=1 Tax=Butyrivibrio sp. AE3006 TaxID=1280673 RepID=UPI0004193175|nr:hypothetical protein [Butyrivibrio sp. AE3006]
MNKQAKKLSIPEKIILFLMSAMTAVIICGIFWNMSSNTIADKKYKIVVFVAALFFTLCFCLLIRKWFCLVETLPEKWQKIVSVVLFLIQLLISVWLFVSIDFRPNTDSLTDIDLGWFLKNNVIDDNNYHIKWIKMYPNNYFLILLFKQFAIMADHLGITDIMSYLWVINYLHMFAGMLLSFLCVVEIAGHAMANKALSLMVLNPLYYYLSFWVYSSSISVPLLMGICYVLLKLYREDGLLKKGLLCVILAALLILGFHVRLTAVFPVIAYLVIRIFDFFSMDKSERREQKYLIRMAFALGVMIVAFAGIKAINIRVADNFGPYQEYNLPTARWLYVGSKGDGSIKTEYEDNGFDYSRLYGKSKEEKSGIYIEGIIYNYKKLGIKGLAKLWANKLRITFSDGFPSVVSRTYSGAYSGRIFEFLRGDGGEFFAYIYRLITVIGILLCTLCCSRIWSGFDRRLSLFTITLFGEMLFYLIWEVKGDYSDSLLFLMVIIAAVGISNAPDTFDKVAENRIVRVAAGILAIVMCIAFFVILTTEVKYTHNRINGNTYDRSDDHISIEVDNNETLRQTFACSDTFNKITINADAGEETYDYLISMYNEEGELLYSKTVNAGDIKKGTIRINTDDIVPGKKNCKYVLEIVKTGEESGNLTFFTGDNYYIDSYAGELTKGDIEFVDDLSMKVEYAGRGSYVPFAIALAICFILLFACFAAFSIDLKLIFQKRRIK